MIQTSSGLSLLPLIYMLYNRHGISLLADPLLDLQEGTLVYIIIIIIIILPELGLKRPVSPWSDALFQGLPSLLRPFGL